LTKYVIHRPFFRKPPACFVEQELIIQNSERRKLKSEKLFFGFIV
jgi:hypothetical protein